MPCKKGTKQTSQAIIDKIIKEHENGITKKELAIKYGKPFGTIKSMIYREHKKQRMLATGVALKTRGRPTKDCIVIEEDKVVALRYKLARKDCKIKHLEMENELLWDFRKELERR